MEAEKRHLKAILMPDEMILSLVCCSLEVFHKRFIPRSGLLAATNSRILFVESHGSAEEYSYEKITYFMKEESASGYKLFVRYGDVLARVTYAEGENPEAFTAVLQQKICPSIVFPASS
ncbi:PH domain-containing protein [Ectobacillus ponti]|uniref:PH domain-containing protein n=1 Tax=Ectobacillus ponti TaxID=2961894 RepID=A0AA42BQH1_9BACI|nr:PH domain-containing protein [Ectobacillus ponti]MCP8969882.1 PH domain-containing protein [Ectobacillus ponti]